MTRRHDGNERGGRSSWLKAPVIPAKKETIYTVRQSEDGQWWATVEPGNRHFPIAKHELPIRRYVERLRAAGYTVFWR